QAFTSLRWTSPLKPPQHTIKHSRPPRRLSKQEAHMASYLESYGAIEERKAKNRKLVKRGAIVTVSVVIVALLLYGIFKNHHQEQQVKTFLRHLQNQEYQAA